MGMAAGTSESTEKRRKMTLSGSKEPLEMSTTNMAQMEFLEGRSLCRDELKGGEGGPLARQQLQGRSVCAAARTSAR